MSKKRISKEATNRICNGYETVNQAAERQAVLSNIIRSLIYGFTPDTPEGWEFYRELRVMAELMHETATETQREVRNLDKVLTGDLF